MVDSLIDQNGYRKYRTDLADLIGASGSTWAKRSDGRNGEGERVGALERIPPRMTDRTDDEAMPERCVAAVMAVFDEEATLEVAAGREFSPRHVARS